MYNCAKQIGRVIDQLTPEVQELLAEVVVIDNRSTDDGRERAQTHLAKLGIPAKLLQNDSNYGLGGSQKVGFSHALDHGFDHVIMLHGDDQGSIGDIVPHIRKGEHREVDALLGARFMKGSRLVGYSAVRTLGNHVFNMLYSAVSVSMIRDLGSGLNMYRVAALRDRWWMRAADDLTFNYHMILRSVAVGWKMKFFPLEWREDDQVSNVKMMSQALKVAALPLAFGLRKRAFLASDYSRQPEGRYTSTILFSNGL